MNSALLNLNTTSGSQFALSTDATSLPVLHFQGCVCSSCDASADVSSDGTTAEESFVLQDDIFRWQQPNGKGSAINLTYSYGNLFNGGITGGITQSEMKSAIEEAFRLWGRYAPLNFTEVKDAGVKSRSNPDAADIRIGHLNLGGRGGTLGRANLQYFGDLATQVNFDNKDQWETDREGSKVDFLAVAVHEIGHALGLRHTSASGAIMRPSLSDIYDGLGSAFLSSDDIAGIRALYGQGSGSVQPRFSNPRPTPTPTPTPTPNPTPPTPPGSNASTVTGTKGNDMLTGNDRAQTFKGLNGNDTIRARGGNDIVKGGNGNDQLFGEDGDDQLFGNAGNDRLNGGGDNDRLIGGSGDDIASGASGNDWLLGGRGNDQLSGGSGNDTVRGQAGRDWLAGTDSASGAGRGEIDTLLGGGDADIFMLGDRSRVFYNDGRDNTLGKGDYAKIKDFRTSEGDRIVLKGRASNYRISSAPSGTSRGKGLFLNTAGQDELIAVIQGSGNLDLGSSAFSYV